MGVVVDAPTFSQDLYLLERVKDFPVQKLIAQLAVERFAVAVLPWRAGCDVQCFSAGLRQPFPQLPGHELRTVVTADVLRDAVLDHSLGENFDHVPAVQPAFHADRQTLPRVFIDRVQHPHRPAIMRESAHKIVRPNVIAPLRAQSHARSIVDPQAAPRFLFLWNLQPFATPNSLYAVLADLPASLAQFDCDASISITAILASKRYDRPGQCVFVVALGRLIALRAAWLTDQPARMTLTRSELLRMLHRATTPIRA